MTLLKCVFMFCVLLTICLVSCTTKEAKREVMIGNIVNIIETCPSWARLSVVEYEEGEDVVEIQKKMIMASMKELSKYDLDLLREAIKRYTSGDGRYSSAADARLYLLNRYIFNIAAGIPMGSMWSFAAFRPAYAKGLPGHAIGHDELWPLSVDAEGNLVLTGSFRGYLGEEFQPLSEFDDFRKEFGVRREPGKVEQPN